MSLESELKGPRIMDETHESLIDLLKAIAPYLAISSVFIAFIPLSLIMSVGLLRHVYIIKVITLFTAYLCAASIHIRGHFDSPDHGQDNYSTPDTMIISSVKEAWQIFDEILSFMLVKELFRCIAGMNKAGYTATLVACGWAGAVFELLKQVQ